MKVNDWLSQTTRQLETVDLPTARLDCLVLLEDITARDRSWLLAHPEFELDKDHHDKLNNAVQRRLKHEPLAYIRGRTEFYGREFIVSLDTLEPRPESETILELLKILVSSDERLMLADIGTGSGALAISAHLVFPQLAVVGTEISAKALNIAHKNDKKHKAGVTLYRGDLLEPLTKPPDIIMANLPYVPDNHTINQAAMQEPALAIFGGADGLDLYRKLFAQLSERKWWPRFILTESLPPQHAQLALIAQKHGFGLAKKDDFIQVFAPSTESGRLQA